MPYSLEDKHIIQHYHTKYKWGSQKILNQLGNGKKWSRGGIQKLIEKIDETGSIVRKKGSGRPRSARTAENIQNVREEIFSQEDPLTGEWKTHDSPNVIAGTT